MGWCPHRERIEDDDDGAEIGWNSLKKPFCFSRLAGRARRIKRTSAGGTRDRSGCQPWPPPPSCRPPATASSPPRPQPDPPSSLHRLAQAGHLADIDAALAPLLSSQCAVVLSALSTAGLPDRASALLKTIRSPTTAHLNALLAPLLRRRRLARLVPYILSAHLNEHGNEKGDQVSTSATTAGGKLAPDCTTYTCVVAALYKAGRWSETDDMFYEAVKAEEGSRSRHGALTGARAQGGRQWPGGEVDDALFTREHLAAGGGSRRGAAMAAGGSGGREGLRWRFEVEDE
ncbi:hypothetical protein GUJ93_ZPchr0006g45511 [Zizania palustris]|uniref:Uncharacterized protein n=1 Tax=Zizania palustris TaxID=103762 RepID=A0A8J5SNW1_ZIZPA|nr:hypothetical protein GUJ93_ZPchr0006g45511 [Zizania palustris]